MTLDPQVIRANLARAEDEILVAAQRAGRDPNEVQVLAAVKYVAFEDLPALADAGISLVGENRAQDLVKKVDGYPGRFRWHFIGQLQSRKVKAILPYVELIHSVATESALRELEKHGSDETRVLLQVNVSGEKEKAGFSPDALPPILSNSPVQVVGLMTMPPMTTNPELNRPFFAALRELAQQHGLSELSMGTSQDFPVAVEEGATIVRLGSVLYESGNSW